MVIPEFFKRDLRTIDKQYYPEWDSTYNYWTIKHDVPIVVRQKDGSYIKRIVKVNRAVFRYLNDHALDNLRKRKRVGIEFERMHNPNKYLEYINSLNEEAKAKKKKLGVEMVVAGGMKISDLIRKKIFT